MGTPPLHLLLEVAQEAAWQAGRRALGWFGAPPPVEWKTDGTPVTRADRETEETLRAVISRAFPDHAILGEESGLSPGDAPCRWVIDPIDGTKAFLAGVPLWSVLVGVEVRTEPVVGVIHVPALGEMVAAASGEGCAWNGRGCRVSQVEDLAAALLVSSSARACRRAAPAGYAKLAEAVRLERTWGDGYGYVLVATGRADLMVDTGVAIWDLAPVLPIIEEAGGVVTDWRGRRTTRGGDAIATNGLLHAEALELVTAG